MKTFLSIFIILFTISCTNTENRSPKTDDKNSSGIRVLEIVNDYDIVTAIRTALYKQRKENILIDVYSFYGHVFLIGAVNLDNGREAVSLARKVKGVRRVSTRWFKEGTNQDYAEDLKNEIEAKLSKISDTIIVKIIDNEVILLGIITNGTDINKAVNIVKRIKSVKHVTNFLTLKRKM